MQRIPIESDRRCEDGGGEQIVARWGVVANGARYGIVIVLISREFQRYMLEQEDTHEIS